MNRRIASWLACAAAIAAAQSFVLPARAQPVTRIKARLVSVDGDLLTVQPAGGKAGETRTVTLLDETRYVASNKSAFAAITPGQYAGAAVSESRSGALSATDVYLYDEALRGTGEGRFPDKDRLLVNGTVTEVKPASPQDNNDGTFTLHYRGAVLTPRGRGRTVCEGRATPPPFASPLACSADAAIAVRPGTPVSALTVGDRSLLVPGATLTLSLTKGTDGRDMAVGVIVEKPEIVEKPQSNP